MASSARKYSSVHVGVWRLPLTATALRLYGVLTQFADDKGHCWPKNETILACMPPGTDERGMRRAKTELEQFGLLRREVRLASNGRQRSSAYWVQIPEAVTADLLPEDNEEGQQTIPEMGPTTPQQMGADTPPTRSRPTTRPEVDHQNEQNQVGGSDALRVARRWEELFIQHRGEKPYVNWPKEVHRLKGVVIQLGRPRTLELLERFFTFNGGFVKDSDYGIGAFIGSLRRLQADPVKVSERERPWLGPNLGT